MDEVHTQEMPTEGDMRTHPVTSGHYEETGSRSVYYVISERLFIYFDPVLTIVGVAGNLLMLATVLRRKLRRSPMSVFMSALAVADTLVLIMDFINNWLKMALNINLLSYSESFCIFYRTFFPICFTYAAWAVVAVSVQRFIVVWFPLKAKLICTRKHALLTVTLMVVPSILLNLYNVWTWLHSSNNECDIHPDHDYFMTLIAPWISGAFYSYIPIIVLIIVNAGIIIRLANHARSRGTMTNESQAAKDNTSEYRVTRTVIIICISYLLLTMPLALFYIIQFAAGEFISQGPEMALAETLILILALLNHASNFFLYVMTSDSFRLELVAMVTCSRYKKTSLAKYESDATGNTSMERSSSFRSEGQQQIE